MTTSLHAGGCLCGSVRYSAGGAVINLCYCHCNSCRRATGAMMVAWGTFAVAEFAIVRGRLSHYRSSPQVVRGFCADCGGVLTYRHDARPEEIDVTLASLDDPAGLAPQSHIWVEDKVPWVAITDALPQFARVRR